jgi:hypothetical protein
LSAAEDELSGYIDREDPISEDSRNSEAGDESNISGLNGQDSSESQPSTEETSLTSETQTGEQEKAAAESSKGIKAKPKKELSFTKFSNQLTRRFQLSKVSSDKTHNMLQQIQRHLKQIDKIVSKWYKTASCD